MEQNDSEKIFYKSKSEFIPYNIKSDFINNNFLLIFVNPKSGSQEGKIILNYVKAYKESSIRFYDIIHFPIEEEEDDWLFSFTRSRSNSVKSFDEIQINPKIPEKKNILRPTKFDPNIPFSVIIFNLLNNIEYKNGKNFIKKYLSDFPNNEMRIIIGGGDGSVLSIIEDLFKENINLEKCIFGAMPLGTGNDLSNAMGFDSSCEIGIKVEYFQRVLYTYLIASSIKIDIWNLELKVDKNEGKIYDVLSNGEIEVKNTKKNLMTYFSKTFINYMSIGFDAKIGFMFGQKRTSSRICNKVIYAWEAGKNILKGLFQKSLGLSSLLESLITLENENINFNNNDDISYSKDGNYFFDEDGFNMLNNKKIIFESIDKRKKKNYNPIILKGNPVVLVGQNINFYMGGTEHIWGSTNQVGVQPCGLKRGEKKQFELDLLQKLNKDQSSNDRKIEFITYNHGMDMGLDRVSRGNARKIHQGSGPFVFTFKNILSKAQKKKLNKVYINIDGEFYHLVQPKQIVISLNDKICNGQIKFLKNEFAIWRLKQKTVFQKIKKNVKYYKYSLIIFPYILLLLKYGFDFSIIYLIYMFFLFF